MFPKSNNNKEREERCHYESLLISIHEICNGFLCPFSKGLLDHFAQDLIYQPRSRSMHFFVVQGHTFQQQNLWLEHEPLLWTDDSTILKVKKFSESFCCVDLKVITKGFVRIFSFSSDLYRISTNSFRGNYSFFKVESVKIYIQVVSAI